METEISRASVARGWTRRWRGEASVMTARPLIRPAPRSAMFFPLVVLVAVLPGLYALRHWDLNPPGPWWGVRGLSVLEGRVLDQAHTPALGNETETRSFRAVALQPPLYAWLEAVALALSPDRSPLATVLPSYAAGALVVVLVYLLGRAWRGPALGLAAAVLTGFNRDLLVQMQQATPTTLGLAGALAAMLAYARHLDSAEGRTWPWALAGGTALGLSLLGVGLFGLLVVPVVLLHQATYSAPGAFGRTRRPARWWRRLLANPTLTAGALALLLALAIALPWHLMMYSRYGKSFIAGLLAPPQAGGVSASSLAARLLELAPATLALGLYAAVRTLRRCLVAEGDDHLAIGGALCLVWLAVAALAPAALPRGPRPALNLFLLVPLNLLAAQAMVDLAGRRISARALTWLAPATALGVVWWSSTHLRQALHDLARGQRPDAGSALGLHLGFDVLVGLAVLIHLANRWARRRDDRRLVILGAFLGAVLAVTVASGIREVRFRHRETTVLLSLREEILRREAVRPFTVLAVVAPESGALPTGGVGVQPGGRLRFLLRAALPRLAQIDLAKPEELIKLPGGHRLVILVGPGAGRRLSYPTQARLGLESIHPFGRQGLLEAFASAEEPEPSRTARR